MYKTHSEDHEKPYIKRLRSDRDKDNLEEILNKLDYLHLKLGVSMLTIEELTNTLSNISICNEYPNELRALFFFINEQLTTRNIPPMWRNIVNLSYTNPKHLTKAQKRYGCDLQIIDLHWIHAKHHGHKAIKDDWYGLYTGMFEKELFDYKRADNIANADFKRSTKVTSLKLKDSIQIQLFIYQSDKIKKRMLRAIKASHEVETHIHNAADINPRKGKKVSDQAQLWSQIWLCRKLSGNSPQNIAATYNQMTGEKINISILRKKINRIESALNDVKSKYSLGKLGDH